MAHTSSLVFAGIAPHPPIMVPEVGREAIEEVRASIDAMAELTQRLIDSEAETVVIISPHAFGSPAGRPSNSATLTPARASRSAANDPAGPAPTMTTSKDFID